jgi:hypothetical protein
VFATQGNIDGAMIEFRRAIALRPTSPNPGAMGVALINASRYEEAVKVLADAATRFLATSRSINGWGPRINILATTLRANYRKAIAIRPSAPANSNIGATLRLATPGCRGARQAIEIQPNPPRRGAPR